MATREQDRRLLFDSARMVATALLAVLFVSGCANSAGTQAQRPQATPIQTSQATITVLSSPKPGGCSVTPIQASRFSRPDLDGLPWLQADPASSGITAHLFYGNRPLHTGGQFPDGTAAKILWVIDNPQATRELEITGSSLSNKYATFDLTAPAALSPPTDYPSIVDVPTPGCWQFILKSGTVMGIMVFWVVNT